MVMCDEVVKKNEDFISLSFIIIIYEFVLSVKFVQFLFYMKS